MEITAIFMSSEHFVILGAGDTVLKLNIGGMSFRIRMTSLFSRTEDEKLVTFAQMDHEKRIRSCDAFIVVSASVFPRH